MPNIAVPLLGIPRAIGLTEIQTGKFALNVTLAALTDSASAMTPFPRLIYPRASLLKESATVGQFSIVGIDCLANPFTPDIAVPMFGGRYPIVQKALGTGQYAVGMYDFSAGATVGANDVCVPLFDPYHAIILKSVTGGYALAVYKLSAGDTLSSNDIVLRMGGANVILKHISQGRYALGIRNVGQTPFEALISSLGIELALFFREASGNPVNSGTATISSIAQNNCTQGVNGYNGTPDAYTWNGTTSDVQVTNDVGSFFRSLASQGWAIQLKAASAGESSSGRLINFSSSNNFLGFDSSSRDLFCQIQAASTNASRRTTTALSANAWRWIFMNFDNDDDRLPHIYIGSASGVTEASYNINTAAVGAITSQTATLYIGNRSNNDRTVNGSIDTVLMRSSIWTADEMTNINLLGGSDA